MLAIWSGPGGRITSALTLNTLNPELGGAAFSVTPHVSVFGSLGHTIATADANGAGTTVACGLSLLVLPTTK